MTNQKVKYIKVEELNHGWLYRIEARNARFGVWNKNKGEFVISRFKFRDNYTFEEIHWDLSDHFGTARPIEELEECPYNVEDYKEKDMLTYLNTYDTIKCKECGRGKDEWTVHEEWCSERKKI